MTRGASKADLGVAVADIAAHLQAMGDADLVTLRASLHGEMKRRGLAISVGQVGEKLAIAFFNGTAGRSNLVEAPPGTQNVDALSRKGDRYSIKSVMDARKTGTVYPDADPEKQLFEYLLIVKINPDWTLDAIYEFDWKTFVACRSWDKRMNAWYVGFAAKTLARARRYAPGLPVIGTSEDAA